jgi:beta-phosphoglucomutase
VHHSKGNDKCGRKSPKMSLRAIIFDFNGVILDDEHLHFQAFAAALATEGWVLRQADYLEHYFGYNDWGCFKHFFDDQATTTKSDTTIDAWVERKARIYLDLLKEDIPFFPGAQACIEKLSDKVPLAIFSGARRSEIEHALACANLSGCFSTILSADEIKEGKPAPDGYLAALAALRQQPSLEDLQASDCLVIEDAPRGIEAAHAANMRCLAIASSHPKEVLEQADWVVSNVGDLDWSQISAWMV